MKKEQFWHIIQSGFNYHTPYRRRLLVKYIPGLATVTYYVKILWLIFTSSIVARNGCYDDHKWAADSIRIFQIVESAGGRLHVSGLKGAAEQEGPVVFIANHMSMLDTFILPGVSLAFKEVTFVVKKSLLTYPVFGHIMRAVNPIVVKRKNPREDLKTVLEQGETFIKNGRSVILFPQATRSVVFDTRAFNSLGIKLARKAGVPVVPVAMKTDFQSNGKFIKEMGPVDPRKEVRMKFGTPISVEGNGQEAHKQVVAFIVRNLKEWGLEVKEATSTTPATAA